MKKRNLFNSTRLLLLLCILLPAATFFSSKASASDATPGDAYWQDSSPGQTNGYTMAFAEPKTYDGTPYIEITDIIFADVLTTDDVHATATGTLSSADAGTYTTVNIDNITLTGKDKEKYEGLIPTSMTDVPINITIEKAIPLFSFSCSAPDGIDFYESATITISIINDFGRPEGLPDQIQIARPNPYMDGLVWYETVSRSVNQYSMIYMSEPDIYNPNNYGNIPIWAVIPSDSKNYQSIESEKFSILVLEPNADYYWSGDNEIFHEIASLGEYYTEETFQVFIEIWENIDWNLKISQQHIVDEYGRQLQEAYENLVPKAGDYSEIYAILATVPEDLSFYTDESVEVLQNTINTINWDLSLLEQSVIDDYGVALSTAIKNLEYKPGLEPADYSKVESSLSKIPSDLSIYTEESVKALEDIKSAINWNLRAKDQKTVDGYAESIEKAISSLQLRLADYSKVDEALSKIPSDLSLYTEESVKVLEEVKASIRWDLKVKDQATVDGYVLAIEQAIQGLQKKQIQAPQPQASNPNQPAPVGQVSAKTADSSHLTLWVLIFAASACMIRLSFKKRYSH